MEHCCRAFEELLDNKFIILESGHYEATLTNKQGEEGLINVRWCPFCGEGELFDPGLLTKGERSVQ